MEEASRAEALYQQYKDSGFVMINVLFENEMGRPPTLSDLQRWVNTYGITFPVLRDTDKSVWNMYNDRDIIPVNLVIDQNLVIRYKDIGYNEPAIKNWIENLIQNPPE